MHGQVIRCSVKSAGMISKVMSSKSDGPGEVRGPHLFPDKVGDVHGRFGGRGAVGWFGWDLKEIVWFISRCSVEHSRHTEGGASRCHRCPVLTWLAVAKAEEDEAPPFSHRKAEEVEAPPCKRIVKHL